MIENGLIFLGFLVPVAAAAATGALFRPGDWYRGLRKPGFTPPNRLFAPAWTLLYILIAISGFLAWRAVGFAGAPLAFVLYFLQIGLNAAWSPLFFGAHRPGLAMADIVLLWLAIAATILAFWPLSVAASLLLIPYLFWVGFACVLNFAVWRLNATVERDVV
ncbi:TspO/MBR family protein [Amorphus sp. 3PC139-8]|uniref:TspO/MBR family protein n=1 Tax=Amorphus sp. 3PC139-8 TaxID=2735676 RepID=UPI00345DFD44